MKIFLNFTVNELLKQQSFTRSRNILDFQTQKIRFFCSISSGQDSTVTLFLLLHKDKKEFLQFLYCNHFWQIKNFFSARSLYQISYFSNVPYTFILPETSFLTENESREWRKKNFYRFSQVEKISFLVTGHTETDTVEKNLTTVLRGTSPGACSNSYILNYRKTVGVFFSSLNNNINFLMNLEKTKKPSLSVRYGPKNLVFGNGPQVQIKKILWFLIEAGRFPKNTFLPQKQFFGNRTNMLSQKRLLVPKTNFLGKGTGIKSNNKKTSFLPQDCSFEKKKKPQIFKSASPQKIHFLGASKCKKESKVKYCFPNKQSKSLIGPVHPIFYFFPNCPKNVIDPKNKFLGTGESVIKNKNGKSFSLSIETLSSSFCFSNNFSNLKITFLKPLDSISRLTISKFLNLYKIPLVSDITNFSSAFSRNKIRHQLIPFSKSLVNSNLEYLLINFFKQLSDQNTSNQKQFQQLEFFYKILILQALSKKNYFSNEPNNIIEAHFLSNEKRFLVQKLFFDYKNRNLTFFQITKLETFY